MNLRIESNSVGSLPRAEIRGSVDRRSFRLDPALKPAFQVFGAAKANLERLFSDNALCVTSGQQPGLLSGPLYTIYKALSAAALARQLEDELGRPVVPVFWVAGDDHDFAEANHCFVSSGSNDVVRLELRERDRAAALTPMYRERVGEDIEAVLQQLAASTPETEFRPRIIEWIRLHYAPDADLATAFGGALAELLGRFGIAVFSPTNVQAKRAMGRWILSALENAEDLDRGLTERAAELKAQGRGAPISTGDGASAVLIESALGRDRLLIEGDIFRTRRAKEEWTLAALESLVKNEPQRLSPNVLLRPVIEAAILPTVSYVAGPGELAYLPQAAPIYRTLGVQPQVPVPRWTGRVIEDRIAKTLDRYGIGVDDLNLPEGKLEARVLKERMPAVAADALQTLAETIGGEYERLATAAAGMDAALEKPIKAAERGALRDLAGVEKRISRQLKQQNETTVRQLANARNSLFPLGKPQERVLNVTHFLIRYGDEFLDAVFDQCLQWADRLETASDGS